MKEMWDGIFAGGFDLMYLVGFLGMIAFASRFIVQWVVSEYKKESVIPVSFWYLSIVGSLLLLIYAIYRQDPIFIMSYLPNCLIYTRNLILINKQKKELNQPPLE